MSHADFEQFQDLGGGLRLVGSCILDEEQFLVERWHLYRGTEWRPTVAGIHAYAALRRDRKEVRHDSWKARQEADDEWSEQMTALIEEKKP